MTMPKPNKGESKEAFYERFLNERRLRTVELDAVEVRVEEGDEPTKIRGHAAVFNKRSVDLGGYQEIIDPGAFAAAIKRDDVRALFNHDSNYILARNKAGTLTLEEDEKGLLFEVDMPDTSYARDLMVSIERGDVSQCSFAFRIDGKKGERWEMDGEEVPALDAFMAMWDGEKHDIVRHVVKARLYDVSPVTYPAYSQTDVAVRSVLAAAGIDHESVAGALERGDAMTAEDRGIIQQTIDILQGYLPAETEPADEGLREVTEGVGTLEMKRRQILVLTT